METDQHVIDARGLKCPLPVLRAEKWLHDAAPGATVIVLATDAMAKIDIPLFCRQNGHTCTLDEASDGILTFRIVKGP